MSFEIIEKDLLGRIGRLYTKHGIIETPLLMPVVNPHKNIVSVKEILEIGFPAIITNAYIVWKRYGDIAKNLGLHKIIGANIPIMTDSGAYQLMRYGDIEVSPDFIINYQYKIGSDIAVILDIPTRYNVGFNTVKEEVKETIKRAINALKNKPKEAKDVLLVAPIQGGLYLSLLREAATTLAKYNFDIYGVGGPTEIMKQYRYKDLIKMILTVKQNISIGKPVHLFGAGNPMMMAFAVACGIDLFDSASYALYANNLRYMTSNGIFRFNNLKYLPCECEICKKYDVEDLKELPEIELKRKIALHNLYTLYREIKIIKEYIHEGNLWNLLEIRARTHPQLLSALKIVCKYAKFIEKYTPVFKAVLRGVFIYDYLSYMRPRVIRHYKKLERNYTPPKSMIYILFPEPFQKPFHKNKYISYILKKIEDKLNKVYLLVYTRVFALIPIELDEVYPLSQYEAPSNIFSIEEKIHICKKIVFFLKKWRKNYRYVIIIKSKKWGKTFYKILSKKLLQENINTFFIEEEVIKNDVNTLFNLIDKITTING